jgi:hypothetical protein
VRWTEHVHPQVQQPVPPAVPPGWGYEADPQNLTFARQNRLSLIAGAVVAAYIVIALTSRIVLVGILPIVLSVRAMRHREPLAPFAVGAAIIAVIIAIAAITGH